MPRAQGCLAVEPAVLKEACAALRGRGWNVYLELPEDSVTYLVYGAPTGILLGFCGSRHLASEMPAYLHTEGRCPLLVTQQRAGGLAAPPTAVIDEDSFISKIKIIKNSVLGFQWTSVCSFKHYEMGMNKI